MRLSRHFLNAPLRCQPLATKTVGNSPLATRRASVQPHAPCHRWPFAALQATEWSAKRRASEEPMSVGGARWLLVPPHAWSPTNHDPGQWRDETRKYRRDDKIDEKFRRLQFLAARKLVVESPYPVGTCWVRHTHVRQGRATKGLGLVGRWVDCRSACRGSQGGWGGGRQWDSEGQRPDGGPPSAPATWGTRGCNWNGRALRTPRPRTPGTRPLLPA